MDKNKIMIGWEFIPYLLLLVTLFVIPREASIFQDVNIKSLTATSWTLIFAIVILASSASLTFEGFMRFSRYRMSRDFRVLNIIVSLVGAAMPFCVIVIALLGYVFYAPFATVLAYLIIGYSYYISPRDPVTFKQRKFYHCKYFAYLVNAGLLSVILALILFVS